MQELLAQHNLAVESRKKKNESVNELLAGARACRRCETGFVRVKRPERPDVIEHFGPVYGIACKACNASVYPPPELHLMRRANEFLDAALSLSSAAASGTERILVVLFLLYHAAELYLKCLGTYTYYIGSTPVDRVTYETEERTEGAETDEEPDKLFLSHALPEALSCIPRPVKHRLICFAEAQSTDIREVIGALPEAVNLYCRYPWVPPRHEVAIKTVPYSAEELLPILRNLREVLRCFASNERRGTV